MFKATVVHKRFRYRRGGYNLIVSANYKRIMKIIAKAIKENKEVIFNHQIITNDDKTWYDGKWYDQITVEIN